MDTAASRDLAARKIEALQNRGLKSMKRAPSSRPMRPVDRNPNKPGLGWGGLNPKRANKDKTPTSIANAPGRATIHPGYRTDTPTVSKDKPITPTPAMQQPGRATIMPVPGSAGAPSLPSNEQRLKIAALAKSDKGSVNKSKAKNNAARAQRQAKLVDALKNSNGKVNARQKMRFKKAAAFRAARMKALKSR